MTYADTDPRWDFPQRVAVKSGWRPAKSRLLGAGLYEGKAAVYIGGERVALATCVSNTRARAVRGARRLARISA